ncbi:jacalin-like lectin [Crossiella sp. NPDC003009]
MRTRLTAAGLTLALSLTLPITPAAAAPAAGGGFSVLTYNIAGLPEGISSGNPAVNTPLISPRLAPYDVVAVQEDFNYHAALYAGDNHPHRTATSGGAGIGDGLNTLSAFPVQDFTRVKWAACNGTDCLTPKGFTVSRLRVAEGVHLDHYNLHANAGVTEADLAARRANITQLTRFIATHSAGNAVLVTGDTNTRYTRAGDNIRELVAGAGLTDPWVELVRGGQPPAAGAPALVCGPAAVTTECEVVDKIFYRGNRLLRLAARSYHNEHAKFLDAKGKPLSDHYPHLTRFEFTLAEGIRLSDHFGGPHGTPFTDLDRVSGPLAERAVVLRGAERLDAVELTRADGTTLRHGGSGGSASTLTLDPGERLVRLTLTKGQHSGRTRVFSAQLATDRGRVASAGRPTGDAVTFTAPPGWRIAGFTGRAGVEVDQLGVIYLPS